MFYDDQIVDNCGSVNGQKKRNFCNKLLKNRSIAQSSFHHNPSSFSIEDGLIKVFTIKNELFGPQDEWWDAEDSFKSCSVKSLRIDNDLNKGILGQLSRVEWMREREGIIQEGAGDTPGTWDKGGDTVNMGSPQNKTCNFTELWTKEAPPSPLDYGSLWK